MALEMELDAEAIAVLIGRNLEDSLTGMTVRQLFNRSCSKGVDNQHV